jgi:predicted transcriptional regulator
MTFLGFCNVVVEKLKTRSSTDIIGLILQAAEGEPVTRSKIMYHAILNFKQVTDYAALLTDAGLLTYLKENRRYGITEKGRRFLRLFNETSKLFMVADDDDDDNSHNHLVISNRVARNQEQEQQQEVLLNE